MTTRPCRPQARQRSALSTPLAGGSPGPWRRPAGALWLAGTIAGGLLAPASAQHVDPARSPDQTVLVTDKLPEPSGKDTLRATQSRIGKGLQDLRDIPQSVTVITEKLIDERNLDTVKDALKQTAGISFLAAEGGEEDIRLRGFSLQGTGDVFVDGIRDPAFYDRDTFNLDRLEVLRGSASMLFGRGSTGGAVNQVSKQARLLDMSQIDVTLGSHQHRRVVADLNVKLDDSTALRLNAMATKADNNGAGSALDKHGAALNLRTGIGERDELGVSLYHLDNRNGMNYGLPWSRPNASSPVEQTTVLPLDPTAYYGMASDHNKGSATHGTATHVHRFGDGAELRSSARMGSYRRDQRASTIRFAAAAQQPDGVAVTLATFGPQTVLTRGTPLKIQDMDTLHLQSDFSGSFGALGLRHQLLAGVDAALEDKVVRAARTAAQGGVVPSKPATMVGTPDDGAHIEESLRVLRVGSEFGARAWGAYAQDLIQLAPAWKLLLGARYDALDGDFTSYAAPTSAAQANGAATSYRMKVGEWSQRAGLLFQPTERHSLHFSAATSFNTSGDAYSLGAANADTPPEQSINLELGGRLDSADRRFSTRFALFRGTKLHERNTDPLLPVVVLSGRRHVAGLEFDIAGKLAPTWEVYGSYTWMPVARVDEAAPCPATGACSQGTPGERVGDRPPLTPRHSGALWTTWQATPALRVGGGITLRGRQQALRVLWEVPSFTVGDLMAEYRASEQLTFKLNVSNVTNKLYADQLYPGHYVPGAGRLLQLTGSWLF
jgi:catecholate siderophore receptor